MLHDFPDIRALTDKEPLWYDSNGTPRFAEFTPDLCPDIYANEVYLLLIACQNCGKAFKVEIHRRYYDEYVNPINFHYGDPPAHDCVGDTMNCMDLYILQAWLRSPSGEFERNKTLEIPMEDSIIDYEVEDV